MLSDPVLIEESDESDYEDAENWVPDPVDADPGVDTTASVYIVGYIRLHYFRHTDGWLVYR